jgi:hypothetical protein
MDRIGVMTLPGYQFAAQYARMYPFTNDDEGETRSGWAFNIVTDSPFDEPPVDEGDCNPFQAVQLYAEDEPIPLPNIDDFTGLDFVLKESFRPDGEVYFTFNPGEAYDVSDVRIRFLERNGERYRVELSALVHKIFADPTLLTYSGWLDVGEDE